MAKKKTIVKKQLPKNPLEDEALEAAWKVARRPADSVHNPFNISDGIYNDVPFADYCQIDAVNWHSLALMQYSPLHFRYTPQRNEAPHLALGNLLHSGALEPAMLTRRYVVIPEEKFVAETQSERVRQVDSKGKSPAEYASPKATKLYKDKVLMYMQSHVGKTAVSAQWFANMVGMLKSLNQNLRAREYFTDGDAETVLVWTDPELDVRCKARLDFLSRKHEWISDLKTTEKLFRWELDNFDTHCQLAFYRRGVRALIPKSKDFDVFVVLAESKPPFGVMAAPMSERAGAIGENTCVTLLQRVKDCRRSRKWPGPVDPMEWDLSNWFKEDWWTQYHRNIS